VFDDECKHLKHRNIQRSDIIDAIAPSLLAFLSVLLFARVFNILFIL